MFELICGPKMKRFYDESHMLLNVYCDAVLSVTTVPDFEKNLNLTEHNSAFFKKVGILEMLQYAKLINKAESVHI